MQREQGNETKGQPAIATGLGDTREHQRLLVMEEWSEYSLLLPVSYSRMHVEDRRNWDLAYLMLISEWMRITLKSNVISIHERIAVYKFPLRNGYIFSC